MGLGGQSASCSRQYDGHAAEALLYDLPEGCQVLADRADDSNVLRDLTAKQKAQAVTPAMRHRNPIIPHDRSKYRARNAVERFFNKIKNFRAVSTRDDNVLENARLCQLTICSGDRLRLSFADTA